MEGIFLRRLVAIILALLRLSQQATVSATLANTKTSSTSSQWSTVTTQALARGGEIEKGADVGLELRDACATWCGWNNQLCCSSGSACYTAPNNEAECSATALPVLSLTLIWSVSTTVATSVCTTTSVETATDTQLSRSTRNLTRNHTTTWTSRITVEQTLTETPSVTPDPDPASASTPPPTLSSSAEQGANATHAAGESWPTWKKGVVGGFAGAGGLGALAGCFFLVSFCLRRRQIRRDQDSFQDMQRDGSGTFRMINTADIRERQPSRPGRSGEAAPVLLPRPSVPLMGRNPYEPPPEYQGPPWGPNDIPLPPGSTRMRTPPQAGGQPRSPADGAWPQRQVYPGQDRRDSPFVRGSPSPDGQQRRLQRKPVRPMQPTAEDFYEQ